MKIKFLDNEVWYPAVSEYGIDMPYDNKFLGRVDFLNNPTSNQMSPILLSNKGRILYHSSGFVAWFLEGDIEIDRDIHLVETYIKEELNRSIFTTDCEDKAELKDGLRGNLKTAFKYLSDEVFKKDDKFTSEEFIKLPIYNTWMYMPYELSEKIVCSYVDSILEDKLEKGIIIIDDKWNKTYGDWVFDEDRFKNPKTMIDYIHKKGFKVMLWLCPYIDFDAKSYEYCKSKEYLLKNDLEEVYELEWWNGKSACFDFRKEEVREYFRNILKDLLSLGIDGFKFDGGDSRFYKSYHEPDKQSYLWAKFAGEYEFNEIRADFNTGVFPIFERLSDKRHTWDKKGIGGIIPSALALGLAGHSVSSPDMIGGGEVEDIREKCLLKEDIFMAHAQVALCMPNMQFSVLPKKVLGKNYNKFLDFLNLRNEFKEYILELYRKTKFTGEPLVRLLEYEFPNENYEYEKSSFILGEKYLVIPLTNESLLKEGRDFVLPSGSWKYKDKIYTDRECIHIEFDLYNLVVLEKID